MENVFPFFELKFIHYFWDVTLRKKRLMVSPFTIFLGTFKRRRTEKNRCAEKVKPVYARMIPDRHRMTLRNTRPVWKISWASFLLQQIDPPTIKHLSSTVDQSEKEEMDVLPVTPSRLLE